MLTKVFGRQFIPGTPEIPASPGGTYCYTPPGAGSWVYSCQQFFIDPASNSSISVPPGATGPYYIRDGQGNVTQVYYLVCTAQWVGNPSPPAPICTTIPAQPYVPAVPSRIEVFPLIGWDAGANSVVSVVGDCEVRWTMGKVVGVVVGLTDMLDDVADRARLAHAIYFHQRSGNPYFRVMEGGQSRSNDIPYAAEDTFAIRRVGGVVSYWWNDEKLQESPDSLGSEVSVGSALYLSGDAIP